MINYNFRYRGPIEYDKLVLMIFSLHNEIEALSEDHLNQEALNKPIQLLLNKLDDYYKENGILLKYQKSKITDLRETCAYGTYQ